MQNFFRKKGGTRGNKDKNEREKDPHQNKKLSGILNSKCPLSEYRETMTEGSKKKIHTPKRSFFLRWLKNLSAMSRTQ